MESCQYEPVETTEVREEVVKTTPRETDKSFIRQLIICSAVWAMYFQAGMGMGAPTVFVPQLRQEANSSSAVTIEMASWTSSAFYIGGAPVTIVLPIIAGYIGRRRTFLFVALLSILFNSIMFFCTEAYQLLICQLLLGISMAFILTITLMIVSEYTSPKNRGVFMNIKGASFYWGVWASNTIGTYFHWRNIPIFAIIVSIYICLVILIMFPESPYWLAAKGRIHECANAHHYLKGFGAVSQKELDSMVLRNEEGKTRANWNFSTMIKAKEFYKPMLICSLLLIQYNCTGKMVCTIYAIDIIKRITNDETTAYVGMLTLDGITILGMYSGSVISKGFKRRTILFICSSISIVLLFVLSAYLYLIKLSVIHENSYVSIIILLLFSLTVCVGPITLCTTITGELASVKYRTQSVVCLGFIGIVLLAVFIKTAPFVFKSLQMHGAFLYYGLLTLLCTVLLYKYLPETKDKILQEIEDSMK